MLWEEFFIEINRKHRIHKCTATSMLAIISHIKSFDETFVRSFHQPTIPYFDICLENDNHLAFQTAA